MSKHMRVLEWRLRTVIEHFIEEEPAAFQLGRQTHDHYFQSQKEFDLVPRMEVWNALQAKQVPNRLTHAIRTVCHE